jgi:two-component system LytT family response regulator
LYKAVIVEDDSLSAETLKDLLRDGFREIEVHDEVYAAVKPAIAGLKDVKPDLVFLDMELQDGKGFHVLEALGEISFEVIITTAHESYMLDAIKHSALDYLLKPVQKMDLIEAYERFEKRRVKNASKKSTPTVKSNKLVIPNQDGLKLLSVDQILRLESDGPYTTLHTTNGDKTVSSKNLGFYEEALESYSFFRVHHSHLVNLDHAVNYVRGEGGHVVLSDGSMVTVSRRKKEDFLAALGA